MGEEVYHRENDLGPSGREGNGNDKQDEQREEPPGSSRITDVPGQSGEEVIGGESAGPNCEKEEIDLLRDQLQREKEEKEEYLRLLQRSVADFENYRRRIERERREIIKRANEELLLQLLPVLDNLEMALKTGEGSSADSIIEGVGAIHRLFLDVLAKEGVQPVQALGDIFDPQVHEAVLQVEDAQAAAGTIVEEFKKGYLIHERVLRPSMVKVTKT